jgi:ATP-dependent Lon protease
MARKDRKPDAPPPDGVEAVEPEVVTDAADAVAVNGEGEPAVLEPDSIDAATFESDRAIEAEIERALSGDSDGSPANPSQPAIAALVASRDAPPQNLFILPHDTIVVFPELVAPVVLKGNLGRRTIEQASAQSVFLGSILAPPGYDGEDIDPESFPKVGCAARLLRTLKLPDDNTSVVLRGIKRFKIVKFLRTRPYLIARVEYPDETRGDTDEAQAMMRVLRGLLKKMLASDENVPEEFKVAAANIDSPRAIADFAGTYFVRDARVRQQILECFDVQDRLEQVITVLTREVGLMEIGQRIQEQIRQRLEKQQRDFFLREQLKEIRKELGDAKDEKEVAVEKLAAQLAARTLSEEVRKRVDEEMERLKLLPLESPESAVVRNYLDWIAQLPWDQATEDRADFGAAEKILMDSHHGLDGIKSRILEFLAVRKLKPDHRGAILCFVGPPGVGKTSFGRAIADSLGRKFVRLSLGGVRDEAEIRGHRRTYVGALPGRILQGLKQAGSNNPVFMLDELDKIGLDFRGDPASALLEALDPEQNHRFSDHYLEVPFDLSRVLFVATANTLSTIPAALLDRLEVIELAGYTAAEKTGIASRYLVPRQLERHGLTKKQLSIAPNVVREIVHGWTREAGVRNLEQTLGRICRKVATRVARGQFKKPIKLAVSDLKEYLGPPRFQEDRALAVDRPGIAIGLAWTPVGGDALSVEVTSLPGTGRLVITGQLGDVMEESASIALAHVRSNATAYGVADFESSRTDLHVHVPAGAVPKDGPSAGITMATAFTSLFLKRPVRKKLAMTGELTLTGRVLAIGGLRNKVLAARRAGMTDVIVPSANRADIEELSAEARARLRFHYVSEFAEVKAIAFPDKPTRRRVRRSK